MYNLNDGTSAILRVYVRERKGGEGDLILLNRLLTGSPASLTVTSTHLLSLEPVNGKITSHITQSVN